MRVCVYVFVWTCVCVYMCGLPFVSGMIVLILERFEAKPSYQ